jgi:hypothetical protein
MQWLSHNYKIKLVLVLVFHGNIKVNFYFILTHYWRIKNAKTKLSLSPLYLYVW